MIYSQKMSMGLLNKSVHNFQTENRGDMPSRIIMNDEDFMGIRVVRSKDLKRSEVLFVK